LHNVYWTRSNSNTHWITVYEWWRKKLHCDDYCLAKTNVIYERYKFNNRSRGDHESVDEYVTVLRSLVETCKFQTSKDDLIRDRLVCGIKDNNGSRKLLQ
jgi:hypothetical protein